MVLSVEVTRAGRSSGDSADAEPILTIGNGVAVPGDTPVVALRWIDGGTKSGRLVFTLRAAAGRYVLPVRLSLVAP